MAIKLNWDRVKQLHAELESGGWKEHDKLIFVLIEKGKTKKAVVQFADMYKFFWYLMDDASCQVSTFFAQDSEGRTVYRHRQVVGNEEVPNGGNADVISHWAAFTEDEKQTYITLLAAQIDAYER